MIRVCLWLLAMVPALSFIGWLTGDQGILIIPGFVGFPLFVLSLCWLGVCIIKLVSDH